MRHESVKFVHGVFGGRCTFCVVFKKTLHATLWRLLLRRLLRVLHFPFPGGLSLSFRLLNGYRLVWTSDSEQVFVLIGSHWFSYGCRSLMTDTFSWFDDGCILTLFTSNTEYEKLLFVVRSITWCHSNSVWTETGGRFTQENHSGLCWVHICCNGLDHWWNGT